MVRNQRLHALQYVEYSLLWYWRRDSPRRSTHLQVPAARYINCPQLCHDYRHLRIAQFLLGYQEDVAHIRIQFPAVPH
eukprot:12932391-Prorocentrum_lima.AAC.1